MDARIGMLCNGQHYAYIHGYNAEPFIGSREQVEAALGLREPHEKLSTEPLPTQSKTYSVLVTFQHPAWNEVDGLRYDSICAASKRQANATARKMARDDGHLCGGKGRAIFTATEE